MRRGKTDVETAILNNWNVGAVLRGHEEWSDGRGVWSTIRITGMGDETLLARCIRHERTQDGEVISAKECFTREGIWTLRQREWTSRLNTTTVTTPLGGDS